MKEMYGEQNIDMAVAFWGTAGIWTQGLLFTRQALSPAKPQYQQKRTVLKTKTDMLWSDQVIWLDLFWSSK